MIDISTQWDVMSHWRSRRTDDGEAPSANSWPSVLLDGQVPPVGLNWHDVRCIHCRVARKRPQWVPQIWNLAIDGPTISRLTEAQGMPPDSVIFVPYHRFSLTSSTRHGNVHANLHFQNVKDAAILLFVSPLDQVREQLTSVCPWRSCTSQFARQLSHLSQLMLEGAEPSEICILCEKLIAFITFLTGIKKMCKKSLICCVLWKKR